MPTLRITDVPSIQLVLSGLLTIAAGYIVTGRHAPRKEPSHATVANAVVRQSAEVAVAGKSSRPAVPAGLLARADQRNWEYSSNVAQIRAEQPGSARRQTFLIAMAPRAPPSAA